MSTDTPRGSKTEEYWRRQRQLFPKFFWSEETHLADIVISGAKGSLLFDVEGKRYIDLTSQWATNNVGNVHPEVVKAAIEGLERYGFLIHFLHPHVPMYDLAERLVDVAPSRRLKRVLYELSGTGAVEGAVKHAVGVKRRPLVLSFIGQYHGLSFGTVNLGSLDAAERAYFESFQGGVVHVPYPFTYRRPRGMTEEEWGDFALGYIEDYVLEYLAPPDRIAAVLVEPIACEAGVWIPPDNFLPGLKKLCEEHGWFLIDDEVETGFGRSGAMWAIQHWDVEPDMVTIGKGLSGGILPIAAVLGTDEALGTEAIAAGTTFGGHPAACMAATACLEVIQREGLVARSARLGEEALRRMKEWPDRFSVVGDVRGRGLLLAVEFVKDRETKEPDPAFTRRAFFNCVRRGVVPLYGSGDWFLRIEPPLTIEDEFLNQALETMEKAIEASASEE